MATMPPLSRRRGLWALVLALVVLNLLALGVAVWSVQTSRARTEEQVRETTRNIATVLGQSLVNSARTVDLALQDVADTLQAMDRSGAMTGPEINALLERHRARLPEVDAFRVSDRAGRVLWGTDVQAADQVSWADRPDFQAHRANPRQGLIVGEPRLSTISKRWVVTLTRPYLDRHGAFAGMVRSALPADYLNGLLSKLDLGDHGAASIRHENLTLVTRYRPGSREQAEPGKSGVSAEFKAVAASGLQSTHFHTQNTTAGHPRLYAFYRLPGLPPVIAASGVCVLPDLLLCQKLRAEALSSLNSIFRLTGLLDWRRT